MSATLQCGGIVLCGGKSSRMGVDKASLRFGTESLLARVTRLMGEVVTPVVVVAQAGQPLPELSPGITIVHDRRPERGPLEGLAAGLRTIGSHGCRQALLCAVDMPLLDPAVLLQLVEMSAGHPAATPIVDGHAQPLCAVYSVDLLPDIQQMAATGRSGPAALLAREDVLRIDQARFADPAALQRTLCNVNTWDDYREVLRAAGVVPPDDSQV